MAKLLVEFYGKATPQQYDNVWADLRAAGHSNPEGLLYHIGAQDGENWSVIETWESPEAFERFGATLMPLIAKHGIDIQAPKMTPVYYEYRGAAVPEEMA